MKIANGIWNWKNLAGIKFIYGGLQQLINAINSIINSGRDPGGTCPHKF